MARSKTAQPKHSLRKIAVVVATAVSGMSVYAQAAVEPKEDTITVTAAPAPQESAWGPVEYGQQASDHRTAERSSV